MSDNTLVPSSVIPAKEDPMYPFFEYDGDLWFVVFGKKEGYRKACVGIPKVIKKFIESPIFYIVDVGDGSTVPMRADLLFTPYLSNILINHGLIPLDRAAPFGTYFEKYVDLHMPKNAVDDASQKKVE